MNKKRILFFSSLALNLVFICGLGYMVIQKGGISYLVDKTSSLLGNSSVQTVTNTNLDYLKKQSLYDSLPINEDATVFLGDSITGGVEWSEVFHSLNYVNRGIPGDTSDGVLKRLDSVIKYQPEKIFLMIGVNDLFTKGNSEDLLNNYKEIINKIQKDSPRTKIYVQSILPINTDKYTLLKPEGMSNHLIKKTNNQLEKLLKERQLIFIDLYGEMAANNDELNPDYTFDGIHLTGEAYMKWRDSIESYLK